QQRRPVDLHQGQRAPHLPQRSDYFIQLADFFRIIDIVFQLPLRIDEQLPQLFLDPFKGVEMDCVAKLHYISPMGTGTTCKNTRRHQPLTTVLTSSVSGSLNPATEVRRALANSVRLLMDLAV